ncbi:MAG: hypothetical protein PHH08_02055 [Candidatus ainarchaeum sp.]|nr:hypothetical protein [Candidatus ainarchaeum sp.]
MKFKLAAFLFFLLFVGGVFAACGNGVCESGENQCSCSQDCGTCSGQYGNEPCKELACVSGVCKIVQKTNCCGNATCEAGETYNVCPADCTPKSIDITVFVPAENDYFLFGERVNVLVGIMADKASKVIGADASFTFRGKTYPILNDGKHGDSTAFDAIYGAFVPVTKEMLGSNPLAFTAVFRGVTGKASASLVVRPDLNVGMDVPSTVFLGDVLNLRGTVTAKKIPVAIPLDANIVFQGKSVFDLAVNSDGNSGAFKIVYPISLLNKLGVYTVIVSGIDGNGNRAYFEKSFEVKEKVFVEKLSIKIEPLQKQSFVRGEEVPLVLAMVDDAGAAVEKAEVFVEAFGEKTQFFEFEPGKYSAAITIPVAAAEGENMFVIYAAKKEGSVVVAETSGYGTFLVEKTMPLIEARSPKDDTFKIGETVSFDILASYPDGSKVVEARAFVLIGAREIPLSQTEPGHFVGSYVFTEEDSGDQFVSIKVADFYGNVVSQEKKISVSGESFFYVLAKNALILVVAFVIAALVIFFSLGAVLGRISIVSREKAVANAQAKIRELQTNYFKKSLITREQYESEMQRLGDRLRKLKGEG